MQNSGLLAGAKAIERWNAELAFRAVVEAAADQAGLTSLRHLVKNLAQSLGVAHVFVAEFAGAEDRVKTIVFWSRGNWRSNVEYTLPGTPCERVVAGELCLYEDDVQRRFPHDSDLVVLGARSYLGGPLRDASGRMLGHIAALDTATMPEEARRLTIFQVFANRARVELERLHAEAMLQRACSDLELSLDTARHLQTLDDVQRHHVLETLASTGWVIEGERGAAAVLGLRPSTLRSRMRKLGLRRPGA
jgi:hypothetical protein